MTKEDRETIRILKKARKLLSKPERWTKGDYGDPEHGPCCVVGAICSAGGFKRLSMAAESCASHAFGRGLPKQPWGSPNIEDWNDHPRRKHSDVLARFDRTIARLEAK